MFPARFFPWRFFPRRSVVAPGTSQKARIHAALLQIGSLGAYPAITYGADGAMSAGASVAPATILANEISSAHVEQATHWRRGWRQDRKTWRWRLHLDFHVEVSLEAFEEDLLLYPRWIPATGTLRQVRLVFLSSAYTHPVTHGAAAGTKAAFDFEASQTAE